MYGIYQDSILARAIAKENTYKREYIKLETFRNPLLALNDLVDTVVSYIKEKLSEPTLVPVYCFEYAPDC